MTLHTMLFNTHIFIRWPLKLWANLSQHYEKLSDTWYSRTNNYAESQNRVLKLFYEDQKPSSMRHDYLNINLLSFLLSAPMEYIWQCMKWVEFAATDGGDLCSGVLAAKKSKPTVPSITNSLNLQPMVSIMDKVYNRQLGEQKLHPFQAHAHTCTHKHNMHMHLHTNTREQHYLLLPFFM